MENEIMTKEMKHQVCSMEELAEQYCGQLPRPKVQIDVLDNDIVIGFESGVVNSVGGERTFEYVHFECHTKHNNCNIEECKNNVLNEFIKEVSCQAEELTRRSLLRELITDLTNKLFIWSTKGDV